MSCDVDCPICLEIRIGYSIVDLGYRVIKGDPLAMFELETLVVNWSRGNQTESEFVL